MAALIFLEMRSSPASSAALVNIYEPVISEKFRFGLPFMGRKFPMNLNHLVPKVGRRMPIAARRIVLSTIGKQFSLLIGTNAKYRCDCNFSARITRKAKVIRRQLLSFRRSTALTLFSHGLNFLEVVRPAFGGFLPATATKGNGGLVFLCHAERLQKPLGSLQTENMYKLHAWTGVWTGAGKED